MACGRGTAPMRGIYDRLRAIPAGTAVQTDSATANYCVLQSLSGAKVLDRPSPVQLMKAMKTPAEQENFRAAHIKDGVAVCRFICWLQSHVGKEPITECSAAAKLESFRAQQPDYLGPSFDSIMAFGPHGAIVHYEPTAETDVPLEPRSFCLADTGGHYLQGTTDITRTIPLGPLTEEERRAYTVVLKGHLRLGAARFPEGLCGQNLDILARLPLWEQGMDYNHGTGHGVGYVLSVHEGPQRLHWRLPENQKVTALAEGMVVSNEPGYYAAGQFGIRHENLELVQRDGENEYGRFLHFEPLTMVPFDRAALELSLLSEEELALLNAYHEKVRLPSHPIWMGRSWRGSWPLRHPSCGKKRIEKPSPGHRPGTGFSMGRSSFQQGLPLPPVRQAALHLGVEGGTVVFMADMGQLMHHHILDGLRGIGHQVQGEAETVFPGAAAEPCPGGGDPDPGGPDAP